MAAKAELDLQRRDPNGLNAHLGTLLFNDVFGEPDGTHSIDCVWKFSNCCFEFWKNLCYKLLTLCFSCCIAAEWGCEFAYIAFYHVWYITPCFKWIEINCGVCQRLYTMCINCCMTPCFEACGGLFHHFKK
uniref:Caveolin n=1 Tax=Crassostrea virginica TaxID=6565 RepID=A0A8B8BEK7_CRAVI|nr:caveolin-1-like [Crassostrea virginica]XP_022309899.1 caveolin-1-like [Crassostrea virginica]